jgi:hypothetical protein
MEVTGISVSLEGGKLCVHLHRLVGLQMVHLLLSLCEPLPLLSVVAP